MGSSNNDKEEEENDTDDEYTDDDENNEDEQEIQTLQAQHQDIENGNPEIPNANYTNHFPSMSNMVTNYRPRSRWSSLLNPEKQKHVYQYLCTWPDCGKTSGVIWNLRRHIRTVHFKLPKTKHEMQNENINVLEIDRKESQFIHIFTL